VQDRYSRAELEKNEATYHFKPKIPEDLDAVALHGLAVFPFDLSTAVK